MVKVLLIGANGFLGLKLIPLLGQEYEVYAADVKLDLIPQGYRSITIDITSSSSVDNIISKIRPDICINTAAMTNVDVCEEQPELAEKINAQGPANIARAMKRVGGKLLHISTDFVFDGAKGNYIEDDKPNPISVYGSTKLRGEEFIQQSGVPAMICRTSVLYGWPTPGVHANYFSWAYNALKAGQTLRIVKDQITTATLAEDLAQFIVKVLPKFTPGILHTTGPEPLDKYEFVDKMIKFYNFSPHLLQPVDFFAQKARRPPNSSLNTAKIQKMNIHTFRTLDEAMKFLHSQIPN
jgi:dTDP-4-dehydrorhamnose reductase